MALNWPERLSTYQQSIPLVRIGSGRCQQKSADAVILDRLEQVGGEPLPEAPCVNLFTNDLGLAGEVVGVALQVQAHIALHESPAASRSVHRANNLIAVGAR
jgi:hypothetical protein